MTDDAHIITGSGLKLFARRAIFDSLPIEAEEVTIQEGNLTITTRRPKFWTDGVQGLEDGDLTYGDALNALIIQCAQKYDGERQENEAKFAEYVAIEDEYQATWSRHEAAKDAYLKGDRTQAQYDAMLESEVAYKEAEKAWNLVKNKKRRLLDSKRLAFRPVTRFLERTAADVCDTLFEDEYGCEECR